jgi:hypothetical protein
MLVALAAAAGALGVVGAGWLFPGQGTSILAAARLLSSGVGQLKASDLNPIRAIYDNVISQVRSGNPSASIKFEAPSFPSLGPITLPKPLEVDRTIGAAINAEIDQSYQRRQAPIQYDRNPIARHGVQPH